MRFGYGEIEFCVVAVNVYNSFSDRLAFKGCAGLKLFACRVAVYERVNIYGSVHGIGDHLDGLNINFGYPFKPNGLPDASGAGVGAAVGMVSAALLAKRLAAVTLIVISADNKGVFAFFDKVGDLEGE